MKGLFITGTNTAVGKTFIGCEIIRQLRAKNAQVTVRKPIETDCNPDAKDAIALLAAAGNNESISVVCPHQFSTCASAALAATKVNQTLTLNDLAYACQFGTTKDDFVVVEGAGGFYSPLTQNTLNADLAQALGLDLLLVVKDELGCLSQTLLCLEAIEKRQLNLSAVVLNTIEDNALDNFSALKHYSDAPIFKNDACFYQAMTHLADR